MSRTSDFDDRKRRRVAVVGCERKARVSEGTDVGQTKGWLRQLLTSSGGQQKKRRGNTRQAGWSVVSTLGQK